MSKRKICVITGTRAEYGLLYWLMKEIQQDDDLILQIYVTGMHLSEEFGSTYHQIEKDGFIINRKIDISLISDSELDISKSMGLGVIGFADAFNKLRPDLIVVLGDRFEIFSAVSAAMIASMNKLVQLRSTDGTFDILPTIKKYGTIKVYNSSYR